MEQNTSFSGYFTTQEGERCRSNLEAMYNAFLHWNGIEYEYIPGEDRVADFFVGGHYVVISSKKRP